VIRIGVEGVRVAGRQTQGVTLLRTEESEKVVSVARLGEVTGNGEMNGGAEPSGEAGAPETDASGDEGLPPAGDEDDGGKPPPADDDDMPPTADGSGDA
jgi:DNA gyrase subunit A